jgi:hypothetical protein
MVDIPIRDGVLIDAHGDSLANFANRLEQACGQYYGTAAPAFIERLITLEADTSALARRIKQEVATWARDLVDDRPLESFQQRVLQRFSVVLEAGVLAVDFAILPFERSEIIMAVETVWRDWLGDSDNQPDSVRGMRAVRSFVLTHQDARFRDARNDYNGGVTVRNLAGYYDRERRLYDYRGVLNELAARGHLFVNDTGRKKSKHSIVELPGRPSFYAIRASLLEDDI